ncbi:MAG TPA: hypothetical protein VH440_05390 [Candidatus Limnocylindrales bacterium]|jgi:hypothetical protein
MTYDHEATRIHREELDREIESLRAERTMAADAEPHPGLVERARRRTGNALIAAGRSLAGSDSSPFETHAL